MSDLYLIHYASKYYDPVKAHEYYMRTRELKGRRSTSGLNEEGRSAAEYIKNQVYAERDQELSGSKNRYSNKVENAQKIRELRLDRYTNQTQRAIDGLREKLKGMTSAEKARNRSLILNQISKLREGNSLKKSQVNEAYGRQTEGMKRDYTDEVDAIKSKYEEVYLSELDKLKENSEFLKGKSSGKAGGSGGSGGGIDADLEEYRRRHRKTYKYGTGPGARN